MTILKKISTGFAAASLLLAQACSDSNSDAMNTIESEEGEVLIGVTDAPGDFVAYEVAVTSLKLTHQNGAVVETLPRSSNIDFAQYVELTEFLTIATVPRGQYVKGTMTLDYSDAAIYVENESGETVKADAVVDVNGDAVTTLELDVNLENANRLIVAPGVPAHLTVDFDLQASNTVELDSPAGVSVIVEPLLLAEISREGAKPHRARGALKEVFIDRQAFSLYLRPGRNRVIGGERNHSLPVVTDDETHFDIDGEMFSGVDGLGKMSELAPLSAVVAKGNYRLNPVRFVATEVYAGSSVPGGDRDLVRGVVISRDSDTVNIKGAVLVRADGVAEFNTDISVALSDLADYSKQASAEQVSAADISVGQRISASGMLMSNSLGQRELNTDDGHVRLLMTTVGGAVAANDDNMVVALSSLAGRNPSSFDFTGTGVSAEFDADPFSYEIDKNGLLAADIDTNSTIKAAGHVQAFGMAPADFVAETIVDVSALPATLRVNWIEPTTASIDTSSMESLMLGLEGTGRFHHISQAGSKLDLLSQDNPTVVEFAESDRTHFVVLQGSARVLHSDGSTFIADIDTRIAEGALPVGLESWGRYDNQGNSLEAYRVVVRMR